MGSTQMRFATLFLSALILSAPASAFAQSDNGGMHGFFTPEQREMYRESQGITDWHSMSPDQRRAKFEEMRSKFAAMSDADKAKLKADMQAKFDALSPADKQAVEQKIAEHHGHWQERNGSSL